MTDTHRIPVLHSLRQHEEEHERQKTRERSFDLENASKRTGEGRLRRHTDWHATHERDLETFHASILPSCHEEQDKPKAARHYVWYRRAWICRCHSPQAARKTLQSTLISRAACCHKQQSRHFQRLNTDCLSLCLSSSFFLFRHSIPPGPPPKNRSKAPPAPGGGASLHAVPIVKPRASPRFCKDSPPLLLRELPV